LLLLQTEREREREPEQKPLPPSLRRRPRAWSAVAGGRRSRKKGRRRMAAAAAASMGVVREVLGADVVEEVDQPIIDYIANVLADEDFDFGAPDGHGIFEALGELLIDSGCVSGQDHCLQVPFLLARPFSYPTASNLVPFYY
jgi:hypothetical protein